MALTADQMNAKWNSYFGASNAINPPLPQPQPSYATNWVSGGGQTPTQQFISSTRASAPQMSSPPPSSGGGGGSRSSGLDPHINPATGQWDDNYFAANNRAPAPDMAAIDNAYGEAMGYYNQMYDDAVKGKQTFLDQYTSPYEAMRPGMEQTYKGGLEQVDTQRRGQQVQEQSALDAAGRLYNEMMQGTRQRFGGTNSAGDFANAFYNREYMRQRGDIQNTAGQNYAALDTRVRELGDKFNAQVKELDLQKAAALSQAQNLFQQRLDQINGMKAEMAQNKAQMKLAALQEYRNRSYQLEDYYRTQQDTMKTNLMNIVSGLQNTNAQLAAYGKTPVDVNAYMAPIYSMIGGGQTPTFTSTVTGNTGKRDKYGNPIY